VPVYEQPAGAVLNGRDRPPTRVAGTGVPQARATRPKDSL
jgi:hypothetical protein